MQTKKNAQFVSQPSTNVFKKKVVAHVAPPMHVIRSVTRSLIAHYADCALCFTLHLEAELLFTSLL